MNRPLSRSHQGKQKRTRDPYRIVLADDDVLYRRILKGIIETDRDLEVVGEAGDGLQLLNLVGSLSPPPEMAIIDISMPNLGGIGTTARIKSAYSRIKVLIVSVHAEKEYVRETLSAGADGYLLKEGADIELFFALEQIRRGGIYVSPILMRKAGL